ncbi:hypothetical protein DMENIID0001_041780 [Sergentomyia squamirostris]
MDTTQKMTCGACGKHVNYVSEFVFHYQNDHMDLVNNKAIIKCINPNCPSSFTRINDLKKHLKKGHCIENVPMHPDGSRKRKYSDIESTSVSEFPENRDCGPSNDLNEDENISTSHETGEIEKTSSGLQEEQVVDLYLCPRAHGMKLTIEPECLIPKLSSPKNLQPFPTHETLFYVGHSDIVWTIWEVATARCVKTIQIKDIIRSVAWCPNGKFSFVAVASGQRLLLINPEITD